MTNEISKPFLIYKLVLILNSKFLSFSEYDVNFELLKNYYDNDDENNAAVVLVNDMSLKYFNLLFSSKRLGCTKDRLLLFNAVIYFRKLSMLKDLFNKELAKYREAGLINYWMKQHIDAHKEGPPKRRPKKLKIENIFSIFQIITLMYLISFLVFSLEIFSSDYLTY